VTGGAVRLTYRLLEMLAEAQRQLDITLGRPNPPATRVSL
jgi:hypothetical protein